MAEIPEELPAVFAATTEEYLERLAVETAQLEQMVQVRLVPSSFFDRAKPPGYRQRHPLQVKGDALLLVTANERGRFFEDGLGRVWLPRSR